MKAYVYEMYRDKRGQWRWKFLAPNGRIVGNSAGDGYKRRCDCIKSIYLMQGSATAELVEL